MQTGPRPSSSPSSFPADTSLLHRAVREGWSTLAVPPEEQHQDHHHQQHGQAEEERGRRRFSRSKRWSMSSSTASRLSPTFEEEAGAATTTTSGGSAIESDALLDDVDHSDDDRVPSIHLDASQIDPISKLPTVMPNPAPLSETTPLLGHVAPPVDIPRRDAPDWRIAARQELKVLISYTIPIVGTHVLEFSLMMCTVISVGHIGTIELAAASISSMTANVIALSTIQGFCTALDTLCPQAYTSRPKDTSLYALRTGVLLCGLVLCQVIILFQAESLLLLLRQDPRVAERAGVYLKVLCLGLPGYAAFECNRRWLQAQGLMTPGVVTLAVAAPVNVLLNYLLVWGPDWIRLGFVGAPLATAISMDLMAVVSILYAYLFVPRDAWGGLSMAIFRDLGVNVRLGLAGTAMVASEWWCWEIVGLASSFIGPTALAAQSVLLTSCSLLYQTAFGLSVAAAVRVGNLIGAAKPEQAKITSRVTLVLAIIVSGVNSILLVALRHKWGWLFSSEPEVVKLVAEILPILALFQLTDGLSGATGGLFRGAGKATLGALVNLLSYYLLSLPVGLFLAFGAHLGLEGLWTGLAIALSFTATITTIIVLRLDWHKEVEIAQKRMGGKRLDEESFPPVAVH